MKLADIEVLRAELDFAFGRLQRRLHVVGGAPSVGKLSGLSPIIVCTVDMGELLKDPTARTATGVDLTAAAGTYTAFLTVPAGERWHLAWVFGGPTTGSSRIQCEIDGINVQLRELLTAEKVFPLHGLVLDPGDSIGMGTTGNGADSSIYMQLALEVEDAY